MWKCQSTCLKWNTRKIYFRFTCDWFSNLQIPLEEDKWTAVSKCGRFLLFHFLTFPSVVAHLNALKQKTIIIFFFSICHVELWTFYGFEASADKNTHEQYEKAKNQHIQKSSYTFGVYLWLPQWCVLSHVNLVGLPAHKTWSHSRKKTYIYRQAMISFSKWFFVKPFFFVCARIYLPLCACECIWESLDCYIF